MRRPPRRRVRGRASLGLTNLAASQRVASTKSLNVLGGMAMNTETLFVSLAVAAMSLGATHSLAPDHWVPIAVTGVLVAVLDR